MRVLLLGFAKLKYMPYTKFYIEALAKGDNEIHLVIWNRDLKEEKVPEEMIVHEFQYYQDDQISKWRKLKSFFKYYKYAKGVIEKINPDFIVVLHTWPGILMYDYLRRDYKNNYIFDYRDSTYEANSIFRKRVAGIVAYSRYTFISSDGFRVFLPSEYSDKIILSHNLSMEDFTEDHCLNRGKHTPIRISFWGLIREENVNAAIIKRLSNDKRFELHYYGREQAIAVRLKQLASKLEAKNVFFHGEYEPDERQQFAIQTDLLHNIADTPNMMKAVSNKFYDGMIFSIPQLCMSGSHMGKLVSESGIGFECDPYSDSFGDDIYNYYDRLIWEEFICRAKTKMESIVDEYIRGQLLIENIAECNNSITCASKT